MDYTKKEDLTYKQIEEAKKMYVEGKTLTHIAKYLNMPYTSMYTLLNDFIKENPRKPVKQINRNMTKVEKDLIRKLSEFISLDEISNIARIPLRDVERIINK